MARVRLFIFEFERYRKNRMYFERNHSGFAGFELPTTSAMVSFENPEMIHNTEMRQPKEYEIQVKKQLLNFQMIEFYFLS